MSHIIISVSSILPLKYETRSETVLSPSIFAENLMTLRLINRSAGEALKSNNLVVIGQRLKECFADNAMLSSMMGDAATSSNFKVISDVGQRQIRILPIASDASRHNSPLRLDLLSTSLTPVLAESSQTSVDILCTLPTGTNAVAASVAVARAFPCKYSRKTSATSSLDVTLSFVTLDKTEVAHLDHALLVANAVRDTQAWTDSAPNDFNTTEFIAEAHRVASEVGASIDIIQGRELQHRGFGGIWGVGKCSENPPALVHLSLNVTNGPAAVLVGKGITYDSGGLAIKPREGMCGMKRDMGGAAAVLGAFAAISRSIRAGHVSLKNGIGRIDCVLCIAENSVGAASFRNDDVLQLYSGLTVEVTNTDAEGRLVLSDGVAYAAKHIPNIDLVIDMATLTGAATYSAGHIHGALLSNSDDLEATAIAAGKVSGDCVFPMLYAPELHDKHFKSEVADMTNAVSVKDDCPSSCAGLFIEKSLKAAGYAGKWMHVDMAKPVTMNKGSKASGFGVALLVEMLVR